MEYWILLVIVITLILFIFSFSFWRSVKEDYVPAQIFTATFYILLSFIISLGIFYIFKIHSIWIIGVLLLFGLFSASKRTGIRFYELVDEFVGSLLLSLIPLIIFVIRLEEPSFGVFYIILILSLLLFHLVKRRYKSFLWYRSGRKGLSGLFAIGVFFLVRSIVSITKPEMTFLLDEYDIMISGLISFLSFLNIFILAKE